MADERLDKLVSNRFCIPRKTAKSDIKAGLVKVNGEVVKIPESKVEDSSAISYGDREVKGSKYVYIMMNKPAGVLTASTDRSRTTVVDLVPTAVKRKGLFPVGRLDRDTTGLLIITDDGSWAHGIVSPKHHVEKRYIVTLDGEITENMKEDFRRGVTLADGTVCRPALLDGTERPGVVTVTLREGKYHQIKRMFGVYGLGVNALHRDSIGDLSLDGSLAPGESREMTLREVRLAAETQTGDNGEQE